MDGAPIPHSHNDAPRVGRAGIPHPNDGQALGRYIERYFYDQVGNIATMRHRGTDPQYPGWTRTYAYGEPSQLELGKVSNRLTRTTVGNGAPVTAFYSNVGDGYDAHGNMLKMPHLQIMQWDERDQLRMTQRQTVNQADDDGVQRQGERTWYVYDTGGQRIRKVTELANGHVKDERIYLGGFEVYRKSADNLVRETLHVADDNQRIAMVETRTHGNEPGIPRELVRYQLGNHLGSASLEVDGQARVLSYEEYTPYGSTSYQAVQSQIQVPKRYRFTGKERDEESGLYYHGARYYASWLGRWISVDPLAVYGLGADLNAYCYVRSNPLILVDPTGLVDTPVDPEPQSNPDAWDANFCDPHGEATGSDVPVPANASDECQEQYARVSANARQHSSVAAPPPPSHPLPRQQGVMEIAQERCPRALAVGSVIGAGLTAAVIATSLTTVTAGATVAGALTMEDDNIDRIETEHAITDYMDDCVDPNTSERRAADLVCTFVGMVAGSIATGSVISSATSGSRGAQPGVATPPAQNARLQAEIAGSETSTTLRGASGGGGGGPSLLPAPSATRAFESLGSLEGISIRQARSALERQGFRFVSRGRGGYTTFRRSIQQGTRGGPPGTVLEVTIRPNGQVVRAIRGTGRRFDAAGREISDHSAGEFLSGNFAGP